MVHPIFEAGLEIRQIGGASVIAGSFPYNSPATISDRGSVRKELFAPRAFRFAIETEPERRIDLLVGHDFGKPIANRQTGSLVLRDTESGVDFEATLPADPPSWVVDAERAIAGGLMLGISPGFRVPPQTAVPGAEELRPEPGNPTVQMRQINHAVLRELSLVTNDAYTDSTVELRAEQDAANLDQWRRDLWRLL